jgi:hypothetical protein
LKPSIKDALVYEHPPPKTLEALIESVTRIDSRIFERELERKLEAGERRGGAPKSNPRTDISPVTNFPYRSKPTTQATTASIRTAPVMDSDGSTPMELDGSYTSTIGGYKPPLSDGERQRVDAYDQLVESGQERVVNLATQLQSIAEAVVKQDTLQNTKAEMIVKTNEKSTITSKVLHLQGTFDSFLISIEQKSAEVAELDSLLSERQNQLDILDEINFIRETRIDEGDPLFEVEPSFPPR